MTVMFFNLFRRRNIYCMIINTNISNTNISDKIVSSIGFFGILHKKIKQSYSIGERIRSFCYSNLMLSSINENFLMFNFMKIEKVKILGVEPFLFLKLLILFIHSLVLFFIFNFKRQAQLIIGVP